MYELSTDWLKLYHFNHSISSATHKLLFHSRFLLIVKLCAHTLTFRTYVQIVFCTALTGGNLLPSGYRHECKNSAWTRKGKVLLIQGNFIYRKDMSNGWLVGDSKQLYIAMEALNELN